jgi:hypothetical protein
MARAIDLKGRAAIVRSASRDEGAKKRGEHRPVQAAPDLHDHPREPGEGGALRPE